MGGMDIEAQIEKNIFNVNQEKSFIDKLLANNEVIAVRDLMKKPRLDRSDMMDLLNLLSGNEIKLVNYSAWERHVMAKFFVWIREFIKSIELLYDYQDYIEKEEKAGNMVLSKDAKRMYGNIQLMGEHNVKFLCDLYYNLCRSSMSLGATGVLEFLKNKFEISYPDIMKQQAKPGVQ